MFSSINGIGKIGQPHAKELRLDYYFKPYTKVKVD